MSFMLGWNVIYAPKCAKVIALLRNAPEPENIPRRCTTPFILFQKICRPKPAPQWPAVLGLLVRAAVETHRSLFSSSIDDDMGVFFEDTSLHAVYATGQSSGQRPPDAEDDARPTVENPVFGLDGRICIYRDWPLVALNPLPLYAVLYISCLEMFETRALGLGKDLGLLSVKRAFVLVLGVLKIKRVIELRLFKMAGVFAGANRQTGWFWDSIPVSPDTEEVPTGFPDGGEEVDRPADAFGASLSGDFDFGV
ncbi:hypothetical protein F2Q70_00021775 [Brassica cretica]|uniref:Uncharacterized protein n=1 Tax=Brassica cretica TaxID=69181 RepID=A0A8S9GNA5_BRACR|nr:hypothetical protein F2Q70_00021775 [Brassica cretica]